MPSSSRRYPGQRPIERNTRLEYDTAAAKWKPRLVQRLPAHLPPQAAPETAQVIVAPARTVLELRDSRHDRASLTCVDSGDWDVLFRAVQHRLRHALASAADITPAWPGEATAQAAVLECVDDLEKLRRTLADARRLRGPARVAAQAEDAALQTLRAELAQSRELQRQAHHRARHDDLTALPNRLFLHEHLHEHLHEGTHEGQHERQHERQHGASAPSSRTAPARAVLFIDLDGFKAVNDTHGHDIGDALLRIVAARLRHAIRAEDTVARLGGDEFVCVLEGMPGRGRTLALALARKVFDAVSAPVTIGEVALTVRPSIGIAMSPEDGRTPDTLLRSADRAMFMAKRLQTGFGFFASAADGREQ